MKKTQNKKKRSVQKTASVAGKATAASLLQMALSHHQQGELDKAEAIYRQVLALNAAQPDALHYLGVICHQRGDDTKAAELIRQAITAHPLPDMVQNLAVVLVSSGNRQAAIELLGSAAKQFPESRMLGFNLAGVQREAGDWNGSRETLQKLVAQFPDWAEAVLNLANAESNLGNKQAAQQYYLRALELNPNFAAAHSNLGAYYSETDQIEAGVVHNRRAVELEPDFAPYQYNLGNALLTAGRAGEALECFERAVGLDPNYVNAWLNLAAARQLAGDLEGALDANRKALALRPNESKAYVNQGNIALVLRRYPEALEFLKRGIALEESSFTAWGTAGEVLRQLGRLDDARVALNRSLEISPTNGRSAVILSMVEEQANRDEAAEVALRRAFVAPSGMGLHTFAADRRVEARLRLANLMAATGRKAEAEIMFGEALVLLQQLRPGLVPTPDEEGLCAKPMVLFQPIGRAGSLFVHSLIDGHPEMATTPAALIKGFFGEGVWEGLCPSFKSEDWREQLVSRFCKRFAALLDASSHLPVPGNPLGEPTNVGRGFGLCEMGLDRDQVLRIDREKFESHLLTSLGARSGVSAPGFFRLVHEAYEFSVGRRTEKPVLFFHIHNPDVGELAGCLAGNRDVRFLNIVRDPLQAIESWMRMCIVGREEPEPLLCGYQDAVERLQLTLRQASHLAYERYPSATIRLEDIKRNTDQTLGCLASWMGVSDHSSLRESTFGGLPYEAPANVPVKGFETSNLERKPGMFFSEQDQRVMNLLLYPIAVQYGYREADAAYLEREIAWYKPLISEPLDFEKKILTQLAAMGYQKDASGPRRHLESIAQRCIHLLEKFGTYPAMAPWLKVD